MQLTISLTGYAPIGIERMTSNSNNQHLTGGSYLRYDHLQKNKMLYQKVPSLKHKEMYDQYNY